MMQSEKYAQDESADNEAIQLMGINLETSLRQNSVICPSQKFRCISFVSVANPTYNQTSMYYTQVTKSRKTKYFLAKPSPRGQKGHYHE